MRMTLTLDDDVAALLRAERQRRKVSLKTLVNELLRETLGEKGRTPRLRVRYRVRPLRLGRCLLPSLDNVAEVLAVAERETLR